MYTIIKIVRVAHLINGSSAKSKRIRVYRRDIFENRVKNEETGRLEYTDLKTTDYLELSPSGIIDNLIVTNVVESYERITQPSKKVKVKKSNACPKTEPSSKKVRGDSKPKVAKDKVRINALLVHFSGLKGQKKDTHSKIIKALKAEKIRRWRKKK